MTVNDSSTTPHLVSHKPYGIEHPYATTADQRFPVQPADGEAVRLGVTALPSVTSVLCEWEDTAPGSDPVLHRIDLLPAVANAADAAAMAGGDGHLAEAQAAQLDADGGWAATSPSLEYGHAYRYRFIASTDTSEQASLWFSVTAARWTSDRGELTIDPSLLIPGSVEWFATPDAVHKVRFSLPLADGEHVVGFGERFDSVDQRGRSLDSVVFEQYKSQGVHGRTYMPMPFAHVVGGASGWGFHLRTSRRVWFDVGATHEDRISVEVALGGATQESLDVATYFGAPHEVLGEFLSEVGRAEELPEWVFRLWASGNEWNTQRIVMERMDSHRDLDIPVGAVVIEAWSDEAGITIFRDAQYEVNEDGSAHVASDFTYPADGVWPDPKAMIDELHSRGIKVILWQIPLEKTEFDLDLQAWGAQQALADGAAMVREGHAVLESDGSPYHNRGWWFPQSLMPDLSVQSARDWWSEKRRYLVRDLDVDGFKTDGGEHAWGHDLRYGDGTFGDEGNNLYPVHYAKTFGDLLRSEGKAPVTFSRAGYTGSQAHGIFWAGDEDSTWRAFESSITAGITASACGIVYWGWDLAGFSGPVPDSELYLRGAAAATFMPIMQYHSEFNHHQPPLRDRTPWWVAETNDDPEVIDVFRRYAVVRERLVGYLAQSARIAIEQDRPLMRALFFDFGTDPSVWDYPAQFMLGEALLVSPVTAPDAKQWSTYLPDGETWVDVWTGEELAGGQLVTRESPRDIIPVYCRHGQWAALAPIFEP